MPNDEARQDGPSALPPPVRVDCERRFRRAFGRAWDAEAHGFVVAALRVRKDAIRGMREVERVLVGGQALLRLLRGEPPPEDDPSPMLKVKREEMNEHTLLVWAFEERLVEFAKGRAKPATVTEIAVVSLLMGYQRGPGPDAKAALDEEREVIDTSRKRYRRRRTPPQSPEEVAARLRDLEGHLLRLVPGIAELITTLAGTNGHVGVSPGDKSE